MGELILCSQRLATAPYYIDQASLNVYSLEELSYYITHNLYLIEQDFMSEELCSWIEKQFGLKQTAKEMRDILQRNGTLSEFVLCILSQSGYCRPEDLRRTASVLKEMENKSEYECGKVRADRYLENGKYISSIYEYRKLLGMQEKDTLLVGNVWHNLGTAYASLFQFEEAAACYKKAYELNENPESKRECMYAYRCLWDEKGFTRTASDYGLSPEEIAEIDSVIRAAATGGEIRQFEESVNRMLATDREQAVCELADEWKNTYRKNCRV